MAVTDAIPGYTYGTDEVAKSPVTADELDLLKQTVLFGDYDARALKMAGEVLADQAEYVLDVWYGFVADHPHLVHYFSGPDGSPNGEYLARVRARFAQWIHDLCGREWDRDWLDYQEEIALRHTSVAKNRTDHAEGAPADCAFVISSGEVALYRQTGDRREVISTHGPGTILGEFALIAETERLTGAVAQTEVKVIRLSRSMFRRILEEFPETAIDLRRQIAADLQSMLARMQAATSRLTE